MGIIIRFFRKIFGGIFDAWFGSEIKNWAIIVAYIAALAALDAALILALNTAENAIHRTIPSYFLWGMAFMPDNLNQCITAVIDAKIALWVFQFKSHILDKRSALMKR